MADGATSSILQNITPSTVSFFTPIGNNDFKPKLFLNARKIERFFQSNENIKQEVSGTFDPRDLYNN